MIDYYHPAINKLVEVWLEYMETCDGGSPAYRKELSRKIREPGSSYLQWQNDWPTSWLHACRMGSAAGQVPYSTTRISTFVRQELEIRLNHVHDDNPWGATCSI